MRCLVRRQAGAVAAENGHQLLLHGLQGVEFALLGFLTIPLSAVIFCGVVVGFLPRNAASGRGHMLANWPKVRLFRRVSL